MSFGRTGHQVVTLASRDVLPAGCHDAGAFEAPLVWSPLGAAAGAWSPSFASAPASVAAGTTAKLGGARLAGALGAASGATNGTATDLPIAAWMPLATGG